MSAKVLVMTDWIINLPHPFVMGFSGENKARMLKIKSAGLSATALYYLDIESDGGKNTAVMAKVENELRIILTSAMLGGSGSKKLQVREVDGENVKKSNVFSGIVYDSVNAVEAFSEKYPTEFEQYEQQLAEYKRLFDNGGTSSGGGVSVSGEKGDKGDPGADGKSAYELAVDNGFSGTLSEWLNSLKGEKGDSSSPKTLITIIDDDGTNCTSDANTGIRTFLHERDIPLTFAVPVTAPTKSSGTYSIAQLGEMVAEGDEVVMHGYDANDSDNRNTLEAFKTNVDSAITWAKENNFNDKVYVYPGGLYPNLSVDFDAKIAYLKSKGIEMAYTVNNPCESSSREGFEEWNTYENGADYYGTYNKVPFIEMPNGFNHALLINRAEVGSNNLTVKWWKKRVDEMIEKQAYICFFIHSFASGFKTADSNGKTYADYFKELVQYIVDTYGDRVQFVTPSKAHKIIEDMPVTTGMVENTVADYIEDHKDELKGDSGVERQITVSNAVSTYSIKPNILYVFPELSQLDISFDITDLNPNIVNDFHFQFTNGATPCELNLPENVNVGELDIKPNTICKISIVNGLLSFQNWSTV